MLRRSDDSLLGSVTLRRMPPVQGGSRARLAVRPPVLGARLRDRGRAYAIAALGLRPLCSRAVRRNPHRPTTGRSGLPTASACSGSARPRSTTTCGSRCSESARLSSLPLLSSPTSAEISAVPAPLVTPSESFTVTPTHDTALDSARRCHGDEGSRPSAPAPDPDRSYAPHELPWGNIWSTCTTCCGPSWSQLHDIVEQVSAGSLSAGQARSHIHTVTLRQNNWTLGT